MENPPRKQNGDGQGGGEQSKRQPETKMDKLAIVSGMPKTNVLPTVAPTKYSYARSHPKMKNPRLFAIFSLGLCQLKKTVKDRWKTQLQHPYVQTDHKYIGKCGAIQLAHELESGQRLIPVLGIVRAELWHCDLLPTEN